MRPALTTLFLSTLASACGGPNVGEIVSQEVVVSVTGVASAPDVAAIDEAEDGVAVSRVYFSAASLALLPCREDAEAIVLPARSYDALDGTARERISTAVTELCGLRFDLERPSTVAPEGVPEEASLYIEGADADGATFAISSDAKLSVLLAGVDGQSFGSVPLLLAVDVSLLLADVPLQDGDSDEIADGVVASLPAALSVYADDNANARLDEDEHTAVAVATPSE